MQTIRHHVRLGEVQRDGERRLEKQKVGTKKERRRRRAVFPRCARSVCHAWDGPLPRLHLIWFPERPSVPQRYQMRLSLGKAPVQGCLSLPGGLPQSATVQQTFECQLCQVGDGCACVCKPRARHRTISARQNKKWVKRVKKKGGGKADRVPTPPCGTLNKSGACLTLC